MKNQDPLNPLDNAEVTSQMAQLSTVQGIENMNATLEALAASMGANQMAQAANLIGRGVLVPGNSIGPAEIEDVMGFELSRPADQVDGRPSTTRPATRCAAWISDRATHGVNVLAWDGLNDSGDSCAGRVVHASASRPSRADSRSAAQRPAPGAWSTVFRRAARACSSIWRAARA